MEEFNFFKALRYYNVARCLRCLVGGKRKKMSQQVKEKPIVLLHNDMLNELIVDFTYA